MNFNPKLHLRIGYAIALFFSAMFLLLIPFIFYWVTNVTEDSIKRILKEEFHQSLHMVDNQFALVSQTSHVLASSVAEDLIFHHNYNRNNTQAISIFLEEKRKKIQCDQIVLTDAQGNILAQSGFFPFDADELNGFDIVGQTLQKKTFHSALLRHEDVFIYYTSSPIFRGNELVGIVLLGLSVSDQFMTNIKRHTNMEFSIVGDRVMSATSLKMPDEAKGNLPISYSEYVWLLEKSDEMMNVSINGVSYYIVAKKLEGVDKSTNASLMLAYKTENIEQAIDRLNQLTLIILIFGVLFTIIFSLYIGRKFQRIVQVMINVTEKIKSGNFKARTRLKTYKEFNLLADNLNSMAVVLEEKDNAIQEHMASLENTVAQRTATIEQQRLYLSTVLDLQPDMVVLIENGIVFFANQAVLRFFNCKSFKEFQYSEGSSVLMTFESPEDQLDKIVNNHPEYQIQIADYEGNSHIFSVKIITLNSSLSYIAVFHDITQFKNTEKKLTKEAETDSLTGLMNRHRLNKELEVALSLVHDKKKSISFIIIDIDNFKRINDTYGHIVGDYALITLSRICKDKMRLTDIVARWGGEEFVIVLYNTDTEQAFKIIDSLREMIANSLFDHFDHLTCSFGLTQMREEDSIETLTKRADGALYHAKETGKNKVVIV